MSHYRNTRIQNGFYGVQNFYTALQFQCVSTRFLHDTDGILHALNRIHLISAKGHVAHNQRTLGTACYTASMINHLLNGNG